MLPLLARDESSMQLPQDDKVIVLQTPKQVLGLGEEQWRFRYKHIALPQPSSTLPIRAKSRQTSSWFNQISLQPFQRGRPFPELQDSLSTPPPPSFFDLLH